MIETRFIVDVEKEKNDLGQSKKGDKHNKDDIAGKQEDFVENVKDENGCTCEKLKDGKLEASNVDGGEEKTDMDKSENGDESKKIVLSTEEDNLKNEKDEIDYAGEKMNAEILEARGKNLPQIHND